MGKGKQGVGDSNMESELRVVYVIGTYPLLTTTFIDREIETLLRWGVDIEIIAMRRPDPSTPLTVAQLQLSGRTRYVLPPSWGRLASSMAYFSIRRPGRLSSTFFRIVSRPHPSIRSRLKSILHFFEGVVTAGMVRRTAFDELHAHFADRAATVALVAGRLLDKPFSLSIHTGADIYVEPILLREKLEAARSVATCTELNRTHLARFVSDEVLAKVRHVRHGLDLDRFSPPQSMPAEPPMLLSVGQLKPRKGILDLIDACAILRNGGYRFTCEIVGDGPQRPQIEALIDRHDLRDVVKLLGARSQDEVLSRYRDASLFGLPCIEAVDGDVDGIPNVLAEAMAVGVPVVSTSLRAVSELVVSEQNGLLTPPGAPAALATAVIRLLEDAALRRRLGLAGRATVLESFDINQNIERFASTLWPGRVQVSS